MLRGERECRNAVGGPLVSRLLGRDLEVAKARCGMRGGQPTCEIVFSQAKVYGIVGGGSQFQPSMGGGHFRRCPFHAGTCRRARGGIYDQ